MNAARLTSCLLIVIAFFGTGCGRLLMALSTLRPNPGPNPLVGWNYTRSQDPDKLDKAIRDDYLDYIRKLPADERNRASVQFLEDGTGQHAVRIEIPVRGPIGNMSLSTINIIGG